MHHTSKTELVYYAIKSEIIKGKWPPGARRNADEIAKKMHVSRTPVIAGCKLLEAEGLLSILPQVGMEVPSLTKDKVEEIFCIRGVLSGLATEKSCHHLREKDLKKLEELSTLMSRLEPRNDFKKFSKLNREFHYYIFNKCRFPLLLNAIDTFWDNGDRYAQYFRSMPESMVSAAKIHHEIVTALKNRDAGKARILAEEDSVNFGLALSKFLGKKGESINKHGEGR